MARLGLFVPALLLALSCQSPRMEAGRVVDPIELALMDAVGNTMMLSIHAESSRDTFLLECSGFGLFAPMLNDTAWKIEAFKNESESDEFAAAWTHPAFSGNIDVWMQSDGECALYEVDLTQRGGKVVSMTQILPEKYQ